jgi:hypothetical protein
MGTISNLKNAPTGRNSCPPKMVHKVAGTSEANRYKKKDTTGQKSKAKLAVRFGVISFIN